MKMTDWFLAQLEAEAGRTRRALERIPEGLDDWKPHEKSMPFGRLAMLVARMPSWVAMVINRDDLDLRGPGGSSVNQSPLRTSAELVRAMDEGAAQARSALAGTTDDHLLSHGSSWSPAAWLPRIRGMWSSAIRSRTWRIIADSSPFTCASTTCRFRRSMVHRRTMPASTKQMLTKSLCRF